MNNPNPQTNEPTVEDHGPAIDFKNSYYNCLKRLGQCEDRLQALTQENKELRTALEIYNEKFFSSHDCCMTKNPAEKAQTALANTKKK